MTEVAPIDPNKVLADLAKQISKDLFSGIGDNLKDFFSKISADARIGFQSYLEESLIKVGSIKTIISDDPIFIDDIFVEPNFKNSQEPVSSNFVFEQFQKPTSRMLIIGTGGTGKSIFARSLFVKICRSKIFDRIPIFYELKSLNGKTTQTIVANIYYSSHIFQKFFTFQRFEYCFEMGYFMLILDGFDEVDIDQRRDIEAEILRISDVFTNVPILVSGRPDAAFSAWQNFHSYKIQPFSKEKCLECIKKIDFPNVEAKSNFLKQVRDKLYITHTTFYQHRF